MQAFVLFPFEMHRKKGPRMRKRGMTLVELLATVAIVGLLIALLLPAVQSARESARRASCANNMRQLALGILQHTESQGFLPSAGWGHSAWGNATRGFGRNQPGGWGYSTLPFIEQRPQWESGNGSFGAWARPIATFYCPTRRSPSGTLCRTDYAMNGGIAFFNRNVPSPPADLKGEVWHCDEAGNRSRCVGVTQQGQEYRLAMIRDGLSNTYLLAEKYINVDTYTLGTSAGDGGDNEGPMSGDTSDNVRLTGNGSGTFPGTPLPPVQDTPGVAGGWWGWMGSAHAVAFQAAFADGRVQPISYAIDPALHWRLGHRSDGGAVDLSGL